MCPNDTPNTNKVPYGYCHCGCGRQTVIATETSGTGIKGRPFRFLKGHSNKRRLSDKFWEKVTIGDPDECWLWTGCTTRLGYGNIRDEGKTLSVHRVAWELTHGPIPDGLHCLHKCDNPPCCNPKHLFLGTRKDNMQDKIRKGRGNHARGSKSGQAKLTEEQVQVMRKLADSGTTYYRLGKIFGISDVTVARIVKRQQWKHVS